MKQFVVLGFAMLSFIPTHAFSISWSLPSMSCYEDIGMTVLGNDYDDPGSFGSISHGGALDDAICDITITLTDTTTNTTLNTEYCTLPDLDYYFGCYASDQGTGLIPGHSYKPVVAISCKDLITSEEVWSDVNDSTSSLQCPSN